MSSFTPESTAARGDENSLSRLRQSPAFAWLFLLVLLGSTVINYIDRQTLSVLAPILRDEFRMSNTQYAWVLDAFQISYLVMYLLGGRLADILGVRRSLTLFVLWWSSASLLQSLSLGMRSLAACRFLLAVGEGGNWPTVIKAASEKIPGPMRSLAVGVVNSGSSLGAMIAPPLVGWLAIRWGWRSAFVFTGLLGFLWLPLWLVVTRGDRVPVRRETTRSQISWRDLLTSRQAWAVFLARMIGDPLWSFYLFWLPEYLHRERGLNLAGIAAVAWIPFLSADLGNLAGGGLVSWLVARGWTPGRARRLVMWSAALGTSFGMVAAFTSSLAVAIGSISVATFLFLCWAVNLLNLPADFFPTSQVGTVLGFSGAGNGLGGFLFTLLVGWLLDATHSYLVVLIIVGLLVPTAQVIVTVLCSTPIPPLISEQPMASQDAVR